MFKMRPYQTTAVTNVLSDLKTLDRVGVVLPTGAGKTEIFIEIAEQWLTDRPGEGVLILSHLSLLTQQTYDRFRDRVPHRRVGILQAQQKPDRDCRIVISTMQSSSREDKVCEFKDIHDVKISLVIVDEAHYLGTESYDTALSFFPKAKLLGVTATPFRSRSIMLSQFQKVSFSLSMQELIADGYLVPPKLVQIAKRHHSPEDLMAMLVRLYQEKESPNKAVVFMKTIEEANDLRNAFVGAGIKAESVTCDLSGRYRDEVLESFRGGDTMVLTTVNVLSAGFDAPCLEAIFMPYATKSPTLYMQRVGRGLRLYPGKDECRIYVVGDAPMIAQGVYQKVHKLAITGSDEWKERKTLLDDLDFNMEESNPAKYQWTQRAVEIAKAMEKFDLKGFSDMLIQKKFPEKFMGRLDRLRELATTIPRMKMPGPATEKQIDMLRSYGFYPDQTRTWNKGEASHAINVLVESLKSTRPFMITSGRFAGKTVPETPYAYRTMVLEKYPHSGIAKLIREYNQSKQERRA